MLAALLLTTGARAAELSAVKMPDTCTSAGRLYIPDITNRCR